MPPAIANRVDDDVDGLPPIPAACGAPALCVCVDVEEFFEIAEQILAAPIFNLARDEPGGEARGALPSAALAKEGHASSPSRCSMPSAMLRIDRYEDWSAFIPSAATS